ncbi:Farnesoate epoxidase [Orchesella cincta]|uniref:Farnesoate epoxidase n=1 Tax=Orchesella cincta TaxID=48709 RepID=A0A1D2M5U7_ORCCI|nr:Farnesoate epoxidase [Orchesella cincta]
MFMKKKRYPRHIPGPGLIQLLFNILHLRKAPLKVFQKWVEKYGPIYRVRIGTHDAVFISDPKLLKELFSNINSAGRAYNPVTHYFGHGNGISQGHAWEAQRTFTVRKLRDFGVFKSSNEGFLMDGAKALVNFFECQVGQPISGTKVTINNTSLLFFAPFLRHIAPTYFGWTGWTNAVDSLLEFAHYTVEKHSKHLDSNSPRDFIDHYLLKIKETTDPTSSFYQQNGVTSLEAVVGDLLAGGSETSSTTLSFVTLYLLLHKEAQSKAQHELDHVVGLSRQVSLADKPLLPYTEAILLETFRLSSMAAFGVPHRMTADTMFHGYFLPKDSTVISNLYAIHHNPNIWGKDVSEFRPERFLSEDNTSVIHHEAQLPFSTGRRACFGEGLARDTIFLFVAHILQKFNIEQNSECPVMAAEIVPGFVLQPKPFKFVLRLRN